MERMRGYIMLTKRVAACVNEYAYVFICVCGGMEKVRSVEDMGAEYVPECSNK